MRACLSISVLDKGQRLPCHSHNALADALESRRHCISCALHLGGARNDRWDEVVNAAMPHKERDFEVGGRHLQVLGGVQGVHTVNAGRQADRGQRQPASPVLRLRCCCSWKLLLSVRLKLRRHASYGNNAAA